MVEAAVTQQISTVESARDEAVRLRAIERQAVEDFAGQPGLQRERQLRFNTLAKEVQELETQLTLLKQSATQEEFQQRAVAVAEKQRQARTSGIEERFARQQTQKRESQIKALEAQGITREEILERERTGKFESLTTIELPAAQIVRAERQREVQAVTREEEIKPFTALALATTQGRFEPASQLFREKIQEVRTTQARGDKGFTTSAALFGLGAAARVSDVAVFGGQLITHPITTIKSVPSGIVQEVVSIPTKLKVSPEATLGGLFVDVALLKGVKVKGAATEKVLFKGITQDITKQKIFTQVAFKTTTGRKGFALGVSELVGAKGAVSVLRTQVIGKVGRVARQFPTGELKFIRQKPFVSAQGSISKVTSVGKRVGFEQVTIGKVAIGKQAIQKFVAASKGIVSKDVSFIKGISVTDIGRKGISVGIVKRIPTRQPSFKTISAPSISTVLKKQALASVQTAVTPAIIKPTATTPIVTRLPVLSVAVPKIDLKPITQTTQIQTPKVTQQIRQRTVVLPKVKQATAQLVTQKSVQTQRAFQPQRSVQAQTPITLLKIKQAVSPKLKQVPALASLGRQATAQRLITRVPQRITTTIRTPIPTTTIKTPPLFIPQRIKKKKRIPKSTFGVSVRRFGKFKTIGGGLTLPKAIGVGRERVGKTLAATFKITPETKGIKTGGFGTPAGFKRKAGGIFIEQPRLRLSTRGEVQSIQTARRIKT